MSQKTVPVSVRLSIEDADFINQLQIAGATTPSDKLRAIITEARQRSETPDDYRAGLKKAHESVDPILDRVRQAEMESGGHSELVVRIAEWLPEFLGFYLSFFPLPQSENPLKDLVEFEAGLSDRAFRVLQSLLQLGMTKQCACYNPEIIRNNLGPVLELAELIQHRLYNQKKEQST